MVLAGRGTVAAPALARQNTRWRPRQREGRDEDGVRVLQRDTRDRVAGYSCAPGVRYNDRDLSGISPAIVQQAGTEIVGEGLWSGPLDGLVAL